MLIKNSILRHLNSTKLFDTDAAIAAREAQRKEIAESIKVADKEEEERKEGEDEEEVEQIEEETDDEKNDEDVDESKDDKPETDEQKSARLAQEKEDRKQARIQKRIDRLVADRELTLKENEELKKQLAAKKVEGLTEEEVNARAKKLADDMVREREVLDTQKDFEKRCDVLHDAAIKIDKEFESNVNNMAQDIGPIPRPMIYILSDLDNENGADVLNYLTKEIDEAEEIYGLTERRMTAKLIRLSDKLKAEAEAKAAEVKKKEKKEKSNAPPPITPIGEGRDAKTANALPNNPTKNIDDFIRIRNQQESERRKARGY